MGLSDADIAFAKEVFSDQADLSTRKMFGGLGIYSEGTIFALLNSDGLIRLKAADGPFADKLAQMGAQKWTYTRKDGAASSMPYWSLPEAALDDHGLANELAREALDQLR